MKLAYVMNSSALTIIGTSGVIGISQSFAVFAGYGEEITRNKGKVLIPGGIHYYASNSEHAIYIKNTSGGNANVILLEMRSTSTITEVETSSVESDFSSEIA